MKTVLALMVLALGVFSFSQHREIQFMQRRDAVTIKVYTEMMEKVAAMSIQSYKEKMAQAGMVEVFKSTTPDSHSIFGDRNPSPTLPGLMFKGEKGFNVYAVPTDSLGRSDTRVAQKEILALGYNLVYSTPDYLYFAADKGIVAEVNKERGLGKTAFYIIKKDSGG